MEKKLKITLWYYESSNLPRPEYANFIYLEKEYYWDFFCEYLPLYYILEKKYIQKNDDLNVKNTGKFLTNAINDLKSIGKNVRYNDIFIFLPVQTCGYAFLQLMYVLQKTGMLNCEIKNNFTQKPNCVIGMDHRITNNQQYVDFELPNYDLDFWEQIEINNSIFSQLPWLRLALKPNKIKIKTVDKLFFSKN